MENRTAKVKSGELARYLPGGCLQLGIKQILGQWNPVFLHTGKRGTKSGTCGTISYKHLYWKLVLLFQDFAGLFPIFLFIRNIV